MKKYLITENQYTFIRRIEILKDLLDKGIATIIEWEGDNICNWSLIDLIDEVKWQIFDNMDDHNFGNMKIDTVGDLIQDYFIDDIEEALDDIKDLLCKDKSKYDDDDDYYSSFLYGVDNNQ